MNQRVLVVDDDPLVCELLEAMLPRFGYTPQSVHDGEDALKALEAAEFDLVLTDLAMPRMDGLALCRHVKAARPWLPVVLLTAHQQMACAVEAMRAGASDFLAKPLNDSVLIPCLARASRQRTLDAALRKAANILEQTERGGMIGASPGMKRVAELIAQLARGEASVLIGGETGSGKELVARAIHDKGPRRGGPFVAVNCAAIPASLVESELFGHTKGSFTDAVDHREGLMLEADGGTLFLDEIGELPLDIQPKLLRALQARAVRPVGSNLEKPFDARVITATNRDLEAECAERRFREDLYYRINVVRIELPPLRERGLDVLAIAQHLLATIAPGGGFSLSTEVADRILEYSWPGNVRELENCIERMVAVARCRRLVLDDLPERVRGASRPSPSRNVAPTELVTVQELERRYIQHTLRVLDGNKSKAAERLGIDRRTLYRMLDREREALNPGGADTTGELCAADSSDAGGTVDPD